VGWIPAPKIRRCARIEISLQFVCALLSCEHASFASPYVHRGGRQRTRLLSVTSLQLWHSSPRLKPT
jgi:hypothetical protein